MKVERTNIIAISIFLIIIVIMITITSLVPSHNKITGFIASDYGNEIRLDLAKKSFKIGEEIEASVLVKAKSLDMNAYIQVFADNKKIDEINIKEFLDKEGISYTINKGKIVKDIIIIPIKIYIDKEINKLKVVLMPDNIKAEEELFFS